MIAYLSLVMEQETIFDRHLDIQGGIGKGDLPHSCSVSDQGDKKMAFGEITRSGSTDSLGSSSIYVPYVERTLSHRPRVASQLSFDGSGNTILDSLGREMAGMIAPY